MEGPPEQGLISPYVWWDMGRGVMPLPPLHPQHRRLHPHRLLLLLGVPGTGEARGAPELALHVLDDRGHLRFRYGLGHHPPLR